MKKLTLSLLAAFTAVAAYGQGKVAWVNFSSTAAADLIYVDSTLTGGTRNLMPLRVAGDLSTTYVFGLFVGTSEATLGATPVATTQNATTFAGKFSGATADLGSGTDIVFFQIRGWSANAGLTWAEAQPIIEAKSDPAVFFGESVIGQVAPKVAPATALNVFTMTASGANGVPIDGFDLVPVPEPSTFALIGLGLAGLYFIRRRK